MKKHLAIITILILCIILASCVQPQPTRSPISPLAEPMNLLKNPGFEGGTYEPKGEMAMVLSVDWWAWVFDEKGVLKLYKPSGMTVLGQYRDMQYGPRPGQESYVLKPEILRITRVAPYLDPLRILSGNAALTIFKLFGHVFGGVLQKFNTTPGNMYLANGNALAWSRMSEDPNDAHYSHSVGTSAFYAEEGDPLLTGDNDNYRFRICIDPFGGDNIMGSAVVCGKGATIYNAYHSIPSIAFMARADSATVFVSVDSRFGMINSNSYIDDMSVVDITAPPTSTPEPTLTPTATSTPTPTATPKPTYTPGPSPTPVPITWTLPCVLTMTQRVFVLLPPNSSAEWYTAAIPIVAKLGWSIGTSAVDSCLNSCGGRVTLAVNSWAWGCNLAKTCVPNCGNSAYVPLSAESPADLALLLERYPVWLHEARSFGACLPLVMGP